MSATSTDTSTTTDDTTLEEQAGQPAPIEDGDDPGPASSDILTTTTGYQRAQSAAPATIRCYGILLGNHRFAIYVDGDTVVACNSTIGRWMVGQSWLTAVRKWLVDPKRGTAPDGSHAVKCVRLEHEDLTRDTDFPV